MTRRTLFASPLALAKRTAWAADPSDADQAGSLRQAAFEDASGVTRRLFDPAPPLLFVNLWAHWCPGCLSEMGGLAAMARTTGPDAVAVVLLSHPLGWPDDVRYARAAGWRFPLWRLAPRTPDAVVARTFRIEDNRFALPQTLVFAGATRRLLHASEGTMDWSAPAQLTRVRGWLAMVT